MSLVAAGTKSHNHDQNKFNQTLLNNQIQTPPQSHNSEMKTLVGTQTAISGMSELEPELASEKVDACSQQLSAGSKPHLFYRCLLNQHAQKLRKQLPIYQTKNEGFEHIPKFRSTVCIDGVSYTSSNTFQQRKMAEMDVSKIAFLAIMQKSKDEAANLIHEDKIFCKSILVEYAAKMNIEKPIYETIQRDKSVPLFWSSLVFNGVTYPGDSGKSKKEAEQLAARAAILKYLDSEAGNDMSEIINCKFRHYVEMNKVQEISNAHNDTNAVVAQPGSDNDISLKEATVELGTSLMPKSSTVLESCLVQGTTVPGTCPSPVVTQPPLPKVSIQAITPAVPAPAVLTQTPSAGINNSSTSSIVPTPCLGQFVSIPAPHLSSNVIQPVNPEASSGIIVPPLSLAPQGLEHVSFMGQKSERKRNRKNKKKAKKKMRVDSEMPTPVAPTSKVPPCSSQ